MQQETIRERIMQELETVDVVDTHTHLVGDRLNAVDFWQIAHYFWLFRELQAAGYPAHAEQLPVRERIQAFLSAHHASRHTMMNVALSRIFQDLYGIELKDEASVLAADEAVKQSAVQADWAQQVADRLSVREYVVNVPEHAPFEGMRRNAILIPRIDGKIFGWVTEIIESSNPLQSFEKLRETIDALLGGYSKQGCPGIMTTLPRYEAAANQLYDLSASGLVRDQVLMNVLHLICEAAQRHELFVQFFLGVERSWCGEPLPANDPERILKLSGLFERYSCPFELVVASEINNLDVVQAAWNFPNVHVGGHWWYNFRASTYKQSMQYRLEALPALKSSLIASDSRCIEWTYGKIWLVKRVLSEFLAERVASGWLDHAQAIEVARDWLYESAARRYRVQSLNSKG
ncbi:glucuronate isomerase [Paenibacillus sp. FSL H7-0331]|uniref:glucuronate isomerase n=1 Tax=Paenibacillus sp. FSL H7-0331 TaxID=1920421 RepID=UPI00096FF4D9|nr:glucuronate isomerase [Paenibacillus sp. FSL H7-0331]OMF11942.1 glucuronate isomerase [Paenibacillus sp. FSL H7-0331]